MSKAVSEKELNSKYKSYVSQVDKALKSFESTNDWADLINPLDKLNKVLRVNSKYAVIPRKFLISKRLAQCLHHSLPSGVHLKALETFDIIFNCIGPSQLAEDLFIYTTGLFPLLGYSRINVRPTLLLLYETHLLTLGGALRPAVPGLLLALLPGLENGSEFYERISQLLDSICASVEKSYFYTCLWECVHASANVRYAGLTYIMSHFDRRQSMDDQIFIMGTNIHLLVQTLCSGLEDATPLVQRCVLDLLVSCFPIHNCQLPKSDVMKVMTCALGVLLRRDTSLSRRLLAWLMGTDLSGNPFQVAHMNACSDDNPGDYFDLFSKDLLTQSINNILTRQHKQQLPSNLHKPLYSMRLMISLLDRPEIISPILSNVLLAVLRSMYRDCVGKLKENVDKLIEEKVANGEVVPDSFNKKHREVERVVTMEVHKTASILFNHFEPSFIWSFISQLFEQACLNTLPHSTKHTTTSNIRHTTIPKNHTTPPTKNHTTPPTTNHTTPPTTNHTTLHSTKHTTPPPSHITVKEFSDIFNFLIDKLSADTLIEVQSDHFSRLLIQMVASMSTHLASLSCQDATCALQLALKLLNNISRPVATQPARKRTTNAAYVQEERSVEYRVEIVSSSDEETREKINGATSTAVQSFIQAYLELFQQILVCRFYSQPQLQAACLSYLFSHHNKQACLAQFKQHISEHLGPAEHLGEAGMGCSEQLLHSACKLLEKALCHPTSLAPFQHQRVPGWFGGLITMSCVSFNHFNIQYISLGCLFSLLRQWRSHGTSSEEEEEEDVELYRCYLEAINDHSCFFKLVAQSVWENMGVTMERKNVVGGDVMKRGVEVVERVGEVVERASEMVEGIKSNLLKLESSRNEASADNVLRHVELLHHIHQQCVHVWVCEQVITCRMLSNHVGERSRMVTQFMTLWDTLKDMQTLHNHKFDRCILVLLDNLNHNNHLLANLVSDWVLSLFREASFVHLLEPLFKVLLHPDTARVSVQHLGTSAAGRPVERTQSLEEYEPPIVAVSNEGGHIVYHIDNKRRFKQRRCQEFVSTASTPVLFEAPEVLSSRKAEQLIDRYLAINRPMSTVSQDILHPPVAQEALKDSYDEEDLSCSFDEPHYQTPPHHIISAILDDIIDDVINNTYTLCKDGLAFRWLSSKEGETEGEFSDFISCGVVGQHQDVEAVNDATDSKDEIACNPDNTNQNNPRACRTQNKHIHPLKSYILFYRKKYDQTRVICALKLLMNVLNTDLKTTITSLMNTCTNTKDSTIKIIPSTHTCAHSLVDLFIRHKQSILGNDFHNHLPYDLVDTLNDTTYLELLIFVLVYYVRAFFSDSLCDKLCADDIKLNKQVHVACLQLLASIFQQLTQVVLQGPKVATKVSELLVKSKVQKTMLYCMHSQHNTHSLEDSIYTEAILKVLVALVRLEEEVKVSRGELLHESLPREFEKLYEASLQQEKNDHLLFLTGHSIVYQPLLLSSIVQSLSTEPSPQHHKWIRLVERLMGHLNKASGRVLTLVTLLIIRHLQHFHACPPSRGGLEFDIEHYSFLLKSLTSIYHHCVLQSSLSDPSTASTDLHKPSIGGQFVSGIFSVLTFQTLSKSKRHSAAAEEEVTSTDLPMLELLPAVVTAAFDAYQFFKRCMLHVHGVEAQWITRGRLRVLELLNPLFVSFLPATFASFAQLWNQYSPPDSFHCVVDYNTSEEQQVLVTILQDLRPVSLQSLLNAIKHILKQPIDLPNIKSKQASLLTGMLRTVLELTRGMHSSHEGGQACNRVVSFVREVFVPLQSSHDHVALFALISLYHHAVVKSPLMEEKKKEARELQDFTNKLLEACSSVVAMSLEQGTFFRRSLAVKSTVEGSKPDDSTNEQPVDRGSQCSLSSPSNSFSLSVQALCVLADVTSTLLDVVYQSEEKEKVLPLLSNILFNVFPFLKNHRQSNVAAYGAASRLIGTLSGYQYTRKAWRRECMDLIVDPTFFQMDMDSIASWVIIVDNLMSHDKSSFEELITRSSAPQGSSFFTSKDGEVEIRRQLIKRISFAVFCSETDQYTKSVPDIQEKLSESVRYSNYPLLQAEVFNCFRVLLLKMSSFVLAPLWPTIITELTQALISMEKKLQSVDAEDLSRSYQTTDLLVTSDDKTNCWYIATCKLLHLLLSLPPDLLPRFQLYKWSFVGEGGSVGDTFVPHAIKIASLMHKKYGPEVNGVDRSVPGSIDSLRDLQRFFNSLCGNSLEKNFKVIKSQSFSDFKLSTKNQEAFDIKAVKRCLLGEFLEKMN